MNRNRRQMVATLMASMSIASIPKLGTRAFAQDATPKAGECVPNELDGSCLPIADIGARVDVATPVFSNPTNITNPYFPVSSQHSVLMLGNVDGGAFRTEVTLLPSTRMIEWNGRKVENLVSQYTAFIDGRLEEVALDWYAQADDGSVWYFGEDVYNYENGAIKDTSGSWIANGDRRTSRAKSLRKLLSARSA